MYQKLLNCTVIQNKANTEAVLLSKELCILASCFLSPIRRNSVY